MSDGGVLLLWACTVQVSAGSRSPTPALLPGWYVELSVRDSGRGMDAQMRARIFEPFFTSRNGGTGLGLCRVHGIVQRLRGSIDVDSELGRGMTRRIL